MSGIPEQIWAKLSAENVRGDTLWGHRALPEITDRLLVALDSTGKRHLLIALTSNEADYQDDQSRGMGAVTRELVLRGHRSGRYLDITCHDAAGYGLFDMMGLEIAEQLAALPGIAPDIVTRALSKWRRFWGQLPKHLLSRDEQMGLFAELWFLGIWLIPRIGGKEAVNRWRGPLGGRHDFEWPRQSVEVKATTSTRGRVHRINGLDQLMPPQNGSLMLFSLRLREEAGATNTLLSTIDVCRSGIGPDGDALSQFDNLLMQVGYSPLHHYEYAKLHVRIVEEGLFFVKDDFPKITSTSLKGGVPAGVEHVEYEVNLSSFGHLLAAVNATQMPSF